jgi:hypothetical protein
MKMFGPVARIVGRINALGLGSGVKRRIILKRVL